MFKPWISDEGPKPPEGWGLDAYRGRVPLTCFGCDQPLKLREQYLYTYDAPHDAIVFHNKKECYESIIN
jgi:hypothetical protein